MEYSSKSTIQVQKGIENDLENATATLSLLLQPMIYDQDLFEQPDLWTDVPDLEVPPIDSFLPELSEDDEEDYYQYIPEENECCICALLEPGVYCLTHSQPSSDFQLDVVPIDVFDCEDPLLADRPFADDLNISFLSNSDLLEF